MVVWEGRVIGVKGSPHRGGRGKGHQKSKVEEKREKLTTS